MSEHATEIRTDVVVLGGGIAGLTAARLLRAAGASAVVVEPHTIGGRGRTDDRNGFRLNRGPHALYLGGAARRVFEQLRIPIAGGTPSGDQCGLRGDVVGALPGGAASLARTSLLGVRGKVAIGKLLGRLSKIDASQLGAVTFAEWLDGHDLPVDARQLVEAIGRISTYANAPELVSADMVIGQIQMAIGDGVRYVDGGWQTIADGLAEGVEIARLTATGVHRDGAYVVVVTAEGTRIVAGSAVVAVGTPAATAALLGRAPFEVGPPIEAACLDLGTSVPSSPSLLLGIDRPLYLSNHCPPARLAPEGHHVVHVARYLAPGDDLAPDAQRAELMAHAARAGIGDEQIVEGRYLHRMTVAGALPVAAHGGLRGRIAVHGSGVDGVFLAGDWVGAEGHLVDASVASAEAAAQAAVAALSVAVR